MVCGVSKTAKKSAVASQDLRTWFGPRTKDAPALSVLHAKTNSENLANGMENVCGNAASGLPVMESTNSFSALERFLVLPIKSNIVEAAAAPQSHTRQQRRRVLKTRTKRSNAPSANPNMPADGGNTVAAEALPTAHLAITAEVPTPCLKVAETTLVSIHAMRRPSLHFVRHTERFKSFCQTPWRQYREIYAKRLETLRDPVLQQARALWDLQLPPGSFLATVQDAKLQKTGSPENVVVGVLYKEFARRPSVLGCYRGPGALESSCSAAGDTSLDGNLCSDVDVLWLEDASQRLCLSLAPCHVCPLCDGNRCSCARPP